MDQKTLIIDDDPIFAAYMEELLKTAGVGHITITDDARKPLENGSLTNYHRIISDLNMPEMDGIEFIEELAKQNWHGELLIVSGEARNVVIAAARLANVSGLNVLGSLQKPVKLPDLLHVLNRKFPAAEKVRPQNIITARKAQIQEAIASARITPVYQPQLNLRTRQIDSFEALMRLELADGSLATPADFFKELNEQQEEHFALTMSKQVLQDFRSWSEQGKTRRCSINLSPRLLSQSRVTRALIEACQNHQIDPSYITIEVTETEPLIDAPNLISAMSRLRIAGFGLALDDFGSGYANIQELGWFPFSEIKTDLIFGVDMLEDRFARAAIEFAIRAAGQLELDVVVEGLEVPEAVQLAMQLGAHRGQGHAIARPLRASHAQKLALAS